MPSKNAGYEWKYNLQMVQRDFLKNSPPGTGFIWVFHKTKGLLTNVHRKSCP